MPWYDIEFYSDVYSDEYASSAAGLTILGYRYINWWSHGYDIQIDTWLPVARSNEDWQVCPKQWVKVGDPIVEPAGPFTPKFANGSKFTWDGWDTHPSVMPDENITIWAKWRVIRNSCAITWRFEIVDASGNKTYETFLTENKNQGDHLVNADIPTAPERSGYVWAGWEVPYLKPNEWLVVPFQDSWTLTGTYYSTDYSGYAPAGYSVVYYRTKTHNTALTGAMYNEFWHQLVKQGDPVPTPPNNPTTWRGTDGKLYKFVKWGSIPSKVPTSDLYIVAEDEKVPEQHNLGLYLEYYSGTRLWKTIGVLAGTSLEAAIVEAGVPDVGSNYVWDNIW